MSNHVELLLSDGEAPEDRMVFEQYLNDVERGKSLLQLQAVADAMTPVIRMAWSARTFTPVKTDIGTFDEIVANISYHFHKHGQKYGTIERMTDEACRYYLAYQDNAEFRDDHLKYPNGSLYEMDGRIITFVG